MNIDREVVHALAIFCADMVMEPLGFFSEADCQQALVQELSRIRALATLYETLVPKGRGATARYRTSLVHREYGGGHGSRLDVVVFSPEAVGTIDNTGLKVGRAYLKPAYGFELGTEKSVDLENRLDSDIEKLKRNVERAGYIVHFIRDKSTSANGTKHRQKTEQRMERIKSTFEAKVLETAGTRVQVVPILIRMARNQRILRENARSSTMASGGDTTSGGATNSDPRLRGCCRQCLPMRGESRSPAGG